MIHLTADKDKGTLRFAACGRRELFVVPQGHCDVGTFWTLTARRLRELVYIRTPRSFIRWEDDGRIGWFWNTEELRAAIWQWPGSFRNHEIIAVRVTHDRPPEAWPAG